MQRFGSPANSGRVAPLIPARVAPAGSSEACRVPALHMPTRTGHTRGTACRPQMGVPGRDHTPVFWILIAQRASGKGPGSWPLNSAAESQRSESQHLVD